MIKRVVKKTLGVKTDELSWTKTLLESAVGAPVEGDSSTPGLIRRFYTNNYKALDQFDALWYGCCYNYRDSTWEACFLWAIILDCVVNARSAWGEAHGERPPIKQFVQDLVAELGAAILQNQL